MPAMIVMEGVGMRALNEMIFGGAAVADLKFSPNDDLLGVCSDRMIVILAVHDNSVVSRFKCESSISGIAFAPNSRRIATACDDGHVRILDVEGGKEVVKMGSERGGYRTVAWSPDGRLVAGGHYEPWVDIFDSETGQELAALDPNVFDDEGRTCVFFAPDGSLLVSTAYNSLMLWSLPTKWDKKSRVTRKKLGIRSHAHMIDAALSPDGAMIASLAETEGTSKLYFWQPKTRTSLGHIDLPHLGHRIVWSPTTGWVAVAELNGNGISLWNPIAKEQVAIEFENGGDLDVRAIAVQSKGQIIVAGTESGLVVGWDVQTGRII